MAKNLIFRKIAYKKKIGFFGKNRASSLFYIYNRLTCCKKAEKSNDGKYDNFCDRGRGRRERTEAILKDQSVGPITINTYFLPNQPHKGPPCTPLMCWKFDCCLKVSTVVISSANNRLILFKHRFGLSSRSKVTIDTYFWLSWSHEGPFEPPPPVRWWNFENKTKVSKEVVYSANNWLMLFKHRFGMMPRSKVTINTYFRQNQPHKGPHKPSHDVLKIWKLMKSV